MKGLVEFTKYTDSGPVVSLDADVLEARARVTPMTPSPSPFATLTANGGETAQFGLASRGTTSSATSFPREERALDVNTRLPEDVSLNYNYFGMDQPGLAKEAAESCEARMMGIRDTANLQTAIETFLSFAKERYFQPQHTALALTVRVETQQKTFNTPNPHHDGVFMLRGFSGIRGKYWTTNQGDPPILKLGTVLLGPGTVFYDVDTPEAHALVSYTTRFQRAMNGLKEDQIQRSIAEDLKDVPTRSLTVGEMAVWVVGDPSRSAIHSEPDMSDMPSGRIFLSLVPGTPQQIKEMAENWGIPFRGPATTWADRSPFSQTATNDTAPFLRKKVRDDVRFN